MDRGSQGFITMSAVVRCKARRRFTIRIHGSHRRRDARAADDDRSVANSVVIGHWANAVPSLQSNKTAATKRSHQGAMLGQWLTWQIKPEDFSQFTLR